MCQFDLCFMVLILGIVDVIGIEVLDEEYFGLLLMIICYDGFLEVICFVNQICYGLVVGLIFSDVVQFDQLVDEV